mmetsp:Transcript_67599/g.132568  ORF Transcript_67599/g.132568 Transcript_67599/m.132568 type:complete len:1141 (-) Transcript_67599:58-3480(-)
MSKPQKIWVRPRRVDEPMVSYLLGTMSLIEQTGVVEGSDVPPVTDEDELEGLQLALRNVVSELKFQTASCSTDKRTATIVELLARAAGGEAATVMLWRCAPYAAFVAHNRYGSHVLQTLVALVGQRIRQEQKDGGKKASGNSGEGSKFNTSSSSLFWEGRSGGGADDDAEHKESVGSGTEKKDDDDDGDWRRDPVDVLAAFWKGLVGLEAVGLAPAGGGDTDAAGGGDDAAAVAAAISAAAIAATPSSVARNLVGMACDVSATHVLRSLLCVCVGVNVVAEKRGKHAKHGHSIAAATSSSASTTTTTTTTTSSCGGVGGGEETNSHNPALLKLWHKTVAIFAGEDGGGEDGGGEDGGGGDRFATVAELQGMSCDPSGAATLVLLLELEARHMCAATEDDGPLADWSDQTKFGVIGNNNPKWGGGGAAGKKGRGEGKPKSGERVALSPCEQLVDKLLEWDHTYDVEAAAAVTAEGGRQKQGSGPSGCLARTADVVYGLAGEASASHLLETIVRVLPDQKLSALVEHCLLGHFEEYALHGVGNFVVQAVLRVVRNPPVAERVAAELVAALPKVLAAKKTGVLWRLAELLGRRRSRSEEGAEGGGEPFFLLPPALRASAAAAILQTAAAAAAAERSSGASGWAANGGDDEAGSAGVGAGKGSMAGGVLKLLSPSLPATSATTPATPGERLRLKLDVPGARTVEALLRLKHSSVGGCADAAAPDAVAIAFLKEPLAAVAKSKHFFHHRKPNSASSSASYSYSSSSSASSASSSSPSVSCALACAVTQLPSSLLASLAVDSLGSRCVLQPVFASDNGNGDNNGDNATKDKDVDDSKDGAHLAAARRVLVVEKLKGSWGSRVAGDGVGQHTLRAAFVGGDLASKEVIVSELADTSSSASSGKGGGKGGGGKGYGSSFGGGGMSGKLAGSAAGRSSMYLAKLDLFVRGRTEWVRAMKRGAATQHLFKDFLSTSSSEKPAAAVGTAKVSTNFSSSSSQPSSEGSKKRGGVTAEATGSGCNGEEEGGGKKAKKAKPTERSTKKRRERETTTSSAQGALPPPAPSESRFLSALGFDAARDGGGGGVGIGGAVLPMKTTAPSSKSTTDATPSTIAPSTSLGFLKSALATAAAAVDNPDPKKKKKKKKKIAP